VPELAELDNASIHEPQGMFKPAGYPDPIVDHRQAREKTLAMFKNA